MLVHDLLIPQLSQKPTRNVLHCPAKVSWSLMSPFSTNMAISDTKGQSYDPYPVKEGKLSC